jgi:DUF4097 and DUF4098 domain-containing protein YvlB
MTARKIGLLLAILAFGASLETAWSVRERTGFGPVGCRAAWDFSGPSFAFEDQSRHTVPEAAFVEVENRHGEVRVTRGGAGEVLVKLHKVVYLPTEDEARTFASRVRVTAELEGGRLRLATNRKEIQHDRQGRRVAFETHLEIRVPPATRLQVQNEHGPTAVADSAALRLWSRHGDVRVERVTGDAELTARHGNTSVAEIGGALNVDSAHGAIKISGVSRAAVVVAEHGDVAGERLSSLDVQLRHGDLTASATTGELRVRGSHCGVRVTDLKGPATITTSFRDVELRQVTGEVRVEQHHAGVRTADLAGPVSVVVQHGDVQAVRISGPLEVRTEHGGLRAEDVRGGARVNVSGDDLVLDRFQGAVEAEATRGNLRLIPAGPLTDNVYARSRHGGIRLEVPPDSGFDLTAESSRGEVEVDLPGLAVMESRPRRLTGRLGAGGASVALSAENGDVRVTARPAAAATSAR